MINGLYYKVREQYDDGRRANWDGAEFRWRTGKTWTTYTGAATAAQRAIAFDTMNHPVFIDAYNTLGHRIDSERVEKAVPVGLADRSEKADFFRDKEHKNYHWFLRGAPDAWALERGATHTLMCEDGTTRPLRLLKTLAYVGVDELPGGAIEWERWELIHDKHLMI